MNYVFTFLVLHLNLPLWQLFWCWFYSESAYYDSILSYCQPFLKIPSICGFVRWLELPLFFLPHKVCFQLNLLWRPIVGTQHSFRLIPVTENIKLINNLIPTIYFILVWNFCQKV